MRGDRYAVIECIVCGRHLALDCEVGFRRCPYCGHVNSIESARVVKRFRSPKEASELVRALNFLPSLTHSNGSVESLKSD